MTIIMGFIFVVLWFGSTTFFKKRLYPSCLTNFILPVYMFKFFLFVFFRECEMGYKFFSTCRSENYFILIILDDNLVSKKKKKNYIPNGFFTTLKVSFGEGNGKPLSTLAWKISWTEEPGRLQSMGSLPVWHDWATSLSLFTFMHWRRKWQPTPVFLPRIPATGGRLVGSRLWDGTESDTTEAT